MSQTLTLKIRGLYTSSNSLSEVPEGALLEAKDVVIDKDSLLECRRGLSKIAALGTEDARVDAMTSYQDVIIAHRYNDNAMSMFDGSTWTDYSGTYQHPDSDLARTKFADMNGNKYFTALSGVMVLDSSAGPIYNTGVPKGLDGSAATSGVSGWMSDNTQVAYRIVWGTDDSNSNLYFGAPSQRFIVSNSSGGTVNTALTFTIPSGITTNDFYQVYRSPMSASSTTEPSDEMQLVYEGNPSAGDITNKYITLTDVTPDSLKGAYLYTNASQEGAAEANSIPPFATDIATFKGYMFFSGIKSRHGLAIKILSIGGSSGLTNGDTITIDGMTFTGQATESAASAQFKIYTGGSAAQNIDDTAKSLVKVINQYTSNTTVYAYYTTGYNDLPGQITLERRSLSSGSFTATASRTTAIDLGSGTSTNNDYPHAFMWSKPQQPEHVPISHLEFAGSKDAPIRRTIALRDSLIFLKDDGVFRLTGSGGSWSVDPLDTSTHILAPESAVVLNNQIFALTDQGIVTISDLGVAVISRPIEDQINSILGSAYDTVKNVSFGVSYETDRKYILWTIGSSADSYPTKAFVYNTFTKAWTTWTKSCLYGFINKADGLLYVSKADEKYVLKERKSFTFRDFIDEDYGSHTILSYSGTSVVLDTVTDLTVGVTDFADRSQVISLIGSTRFHRSEPPNFMERIHLYWI